MITTIIVTYTQCLKITEKVSFNVASEASYVYILSGQKFQPPGLNSAAVHIGQKQKFLAFLMNFCSLKM